MATIDHVVLYSGDSEATIRFYSGLLGFTLVGVPEWRLGQRPTFRIQVGEECFINVHPPGSELHPRAVQGRPGGLDVCFLTDAPLHEVMTDLERRGVPVEVGPVDRTTSRGWPSRSVYVRDPDGNLLEVMSTEE